MWPWEPMAGAQDDGVVSSLGDEANDGGTNSDIAPLANLVYDHSSQAGKRQKRLQPFAFLALCRTCGVGGGTDDWGPPGAGEVLHVWEGAQGGVQGGRRERRAGVGVGFWSLCAANTLMIC